MKLIDTRQENNMIYIICEYINGCELLQALESISSDERSVKSWFKKLLKGVTHIHERNIIHRDLKMENIIVKLETHETSHETFIDEIKIVDFGCGVSADKNIKGLMGTPQ